VAAEQLARKRRAEPEEDDGEYRKVEVKRMPRQEAGGRRGGPEGGPGAGAGGAGDPFSSIFNGQGGPGRAGAGAGAGGFSSIFEALQNQGMGGMGGMPGMNGMGGGSALVHASERAGPGVRALCAPHLPSFITVILMITPV
jgi:hypothetical protein